ncbi:hypothetical protein D9M73_102980 [compost metagenome]
MIVSQAGLRKIQRRSASVRNTISCIEETSVSEKSRLRFSSRRMRSRPAIAAAKGRLIPKHAARNSCSRWTRVASVPPIMYAGPSPNSVPTVPMMPTTVIAAAAPGTPSRNEARMIKGRETKNIG